jgi:hypothetical protein
VAVLGTSVAICHGNSRLWICVSGACVNARPTRRRSITITRPAKATTLATCACLENWIARRGLADRGRPGEPFKPLEGGDDRWHRETSVPPQRSAPSFGPPIEPM